MISWIWKKNEAPRQSLRSLIYQLRRDISSEGFTYIANGSGGYHLKRDTPYWLDSEHLSSFCRRPAELRMLERKVEL